MSRPVREILKRLKIKGRRRFKKRDVWVTEINVKNPDHRAIKRLLKLLRDKGDIE